MRKLFFFIITLLLLVGHHRHHVKANNNKKNANENKNNNQHVRHRVLTTKQTNSGTIKCVDLADFYYETILAVSSYPSQASCTEQEKAEIASFLQDKVNAELNALPGTIETQNKICNSTINNRRRRSLLWEKTSSRLLDESSSSSIKRFLLRSFIYVGGGRCRYCFHDDIDQRNLHLNSVSPTLIKKQSSPVVLKQREQEDQEERDLMYLSVTKKPTDRLYAPVADVSLCGASGWRSFVLFVDGSVRYAKEKKFITWTNYKWSSVTMKADAERKTKEQQTIVGKNINKKKYVLGPYGQGDQFGLQISMETFKKFFHEKVKRQQQQDQEVEIVERPVISGSILFGFWAFDVPLDVPDDMLADEPLSMYINGIKVDLNLLLNQSNNKRNGPERAEGNSFAGLQWRFSRLYNSDCAFGPLPDRFYKIQIYAPLVVFAHKNQLDVDFIIKPGARASHYAFRYISSSLATVKCEVTGMDNSPFEDFKSVAESRLFHKLGLNLAHEYQSKQGHCLHDKIPIVNVNLVEKENLMDANPQCN